MYICRECTGNSDMVVCAKHTSASRVVETRMKTLAILCVLSIHICWECGGNADGLCAKHTIGESVVEMLLILCALHTFYD